MGLPLFVPRVESDLPAKASAKHGVLAPDQAGQQRVSRRHPRYPRATAQLSARARARTLESWNRTRQAQMDQFESMFEPVQEPEQEPEPEQDQELDNYVTFDAAALPSFRGHFVPVDEPDPDGFDPRLVRRAMTEFLAMDETQQESHSEEMQHILGTRFRRMWDRARRQRQRAAQDPTGLSQWMTDPRPQARRARVVAPQETRAAGPAMNELRDAFLRRLREQRDVTQNRQARDRDAASRTRTMDGLGDRQRSMSPEIWDTLLTTLTPDPEPPSVSTSFASSAATHPQNSGDVSISFAPFETMHSPDTTPPHPADIFGEPPCETSDAEEDESARETPRASRREASRPESPSQSQGALDYTLHAATDGPFSLGGAAPERSTDETSRRHTAGTMGLRSLLGAHPSSQWREHPGRRGPMPWIRSVPVGVQDEETQPDPQRGTAIRSAPTQQEDGLSGMQSIVRRLARREDIPDEWWAEAGLSRTLGSDGAME